jgi:hypothetical protein
LSYEGHSLEHSPQRIASFWEPARERAVVACLLQQVAALDGRGVRERSQDGLIERLMRILPWWCRAMNYHCVSVVLALRSSAPIKSFLENAIEE